MIEFKEEPMEIKGSNGMSEYYQCINLPGLFLPQEDLDELTPYNREAIEDEVWKFLAFLINEMDFDNKDECFGMSFAYKIVCAMSYQEAKSKYDVWKQEKEKVHVGDEVQITVDGSRCIVWGIESGSAALIFEDGGLGQFPINKLIKTGRHFDEVEDLLKKLRGES